MTIDASPFEQSCKFFHTNFKCYFVSFCAVKLFHGLSKINYKLHTVISDLYCEKMVKYQFYFNPWVNSPKGEECNNASVFRKS